MAPYGSGGKNWNLGLSDPGRLGATKKQLWQLRKLTGRDHRGRGYTRDQAADLIHEALKAKDERKEGLNAMSDQFFNATFAKAVEDANRAGEEWLARHDKPMFSVADLESGKSIPVYGKIGHAWISWPKTTSQFHKWLMENVYDGGKKVVPIPHRYADRLEGELLLACEKAAYETLKRGAAGAVADIHLMYRCEPGTSPQAA